MTKTDSVAVLREMIAEMANFADVADRCDVTNAPPAIRCWADRLAEVLAALSAQGEEPVARVIFTNRKKPDVEWLVDSIKRDTPLYLHPAPPGSGVTEEMAADVLHRFNATAPSGDHWPPERARELRVKAMQQAITNAALASRTGKGEA